MVGRSVKRFHIEKRTKFVFLAQRRTHMLSGICLWPINSHFSDENLKSSANLFSPKGLDEVS
jgi:hypothetical protein